MHVTMTEMKLDDNVSLNDGFIKLIFNKNLNSLFTNSLKTFSCTH